MTSLIAANNASSSASASRATGAADFGVVILRGTNTHPATSRGQLPRRGVTAVTPLAAPRSGGGSAAAGSAPANRALAGAPPRQTGLPDVAVRAQPAARDQVPLFARRGEDDDRQQAGALVRTDAVQHLQAVDFRQLQVEEHHFRRDGLPPLAAGPQEELERLRAVPGHPHLVLDVVLGEGAPLSASSSGLSS